MTGAFLANPGDAQLATLLGMAHFWRFAERARTPKAGPGPTSDTVLALHFLQQARRLRPEDKRMFQWIGGLQLVVGNIHGDAALAAEGKENLAIGARKHPAYNLVGASFPMSLPPRQSAPFKQAEEFLWKTLEGCAEGPIDRQNPDISALLDSKRPPRDAAEICHNDDKYPHNFEGIFMNLGDIIAKRGDARQAATVWALAKLSPDYTTWPFKKELESRIAGANDRVSRHIDQDPSNDPILMVQATYSCTGCHQR